MAHRGGGTLAPENTLAAFRLGQSLGYTAHEFDVKLSRDGVAMLLHDETLERTTSGRGRACDFTWAELSQLDAGAWHSDAFRGERIPTFEAVARELIAKGTLANIELKPCQGFERATGVEVALRTRELWRGAPVPPFFCSFSFEALAAARETAPEIARMFLASRFAEEDWARLEALEAVALGTNHRKLDYANIARLHDRDYRIVTYTVNDAAVAQGLFDAGVDGIVTDNLADFALRFPDWI
ncbi:MAG: glycerophosphodiester phosphodiesterase [Bacillota bacterium]